MGLFFIISHFFQLNGTPCVVRVLWLYTLIAKECYGRAMLVNFLATAEYQIRRRGSGEVWAAVVIVG